MDEFTKTTGYRRKHAMRAWGRPRRSGGPRWSRPRIYGPEEGRASVIVSDLFDGTCGRLLQAALDVDLAGLVTSGRLSLSVSC